VRRRIAFYMCAGNIICWLFGNCWTACIITKTKYGGFVPRESGYYKVYTRGFYDSLPCKSLWPLYFYVSEKDTDSDGVLDQYDYDPYDPNVQTKSDIETPGFGAIFAIAGLLAVAYLLRRRKLIVR